MGWLIGIAAVIGALASLVAAWRGQQIRAQVKPANGSKLGEVVDGLVDTVAEHSSQLGITLRDVAAIREHLGIPPVPIPEEEPPHAA